MTDFSDVAKYYQYRHAYLPTFFEGCADTLKLDGSQRLLDVACGTGDVARGFSTYVDSIVAFDGSRNMIDIAMEKTADYPNIQILHTTFDDLDVPGTFDLVTFGRSIHLLDRDFTLSALGRLLKNDGCVIVCGSGFSNDNSGWIRAYYDVWSRWQRGKRFERFDGQDIFHTTGFIPCYQISSKSIQKMSVDDLVNHTLSYPGPSAPVEAAKEEFRHDLGVALLPFLQNDTIEARIATWGNVFKFGQT
jgi:ubiquinone/menaquinone biosynthesis C-methylase UbiE